MAEKNTQIFLVFIFPDTSSAPPAATSATPALSPIFFSSGAAWVSTRGCEAASLSHMSTVINAVLDGHIDPTGLD